MNEKNDGGFLRSLILATNLSFLSKQQNDDITAIIINLPSADAEIVTKEQEEKLFELWGIKETKDLKIDIVWNKDETINKERTILTRKKADELILTLGNMMDKELSF